MHNIKRNYFQQQFYNETIPKIEPFKDQPSALSKPITAGEVEQCANRMSNNKSAGDDSIPVELIKYGPPELKSEIANILNNVIQQHDHSETDIGKSILVTIQKPKKTKGPVQNLRPINLLNVIRKILSNITLTRINNQINGYLSASQSAYRKGRSTSDIVWAPLGCR